MRCVAYMAASLDGYIARPDGGLDWLDQVAAEGEDYGYGEFIQTVDALVMGRGTFAKVMGFDEWPYSGMKVVVASASLRESDLPAALRGKVTLSSVAPAELVASLAADGARNVYVDGGRLVTSFLAAGLLDRIVLSRVPVLLGDGIPLFGSLGRSVALRHRSTRAFASGLVQSDYLINSDSRADARL
ncbi:deaminase [Xenophilus sp. AP218F]|nr:deaminase [Xenophilus sp. AP218F]